MFSLLPLMLTGTGVFTLFHYRSTLLSPKKLFSPLVMGDRKEKKQTRKTLLLALSGTLGVGNITGVGAALLLGGEGSVFWMLLSSILAISLKYAEATLTAKNGEGGGMAGVLRKTFGGGVGQFFSLLYAFAFLFLALVLGGAVQGSAMIENASLHLKIGKGELAMILALLFAPVVFGRISRILHILSVTLPLASIVYLVMCFVVLSTHYKELPNVFLNILQSAFDGIRPSIAGVVGTLTKNAVKEGYLAGLLSNEAGAGTSALAQEERATVETSGCVGVLEVLFDTTFLCTISALTFLVSGGVKGAKNAGEILYQAFCPTFGKGYIIPLLFSIIFLATSSSLCYLVYARRMLHFLRQDKCAPVFTLFFLLALSFGGTSESTLLIVLSHATLSVLSTLTSIAIFATLLKEKRTHPKGTRRFFFVKLFKNGKNC